MTDDARKLCSAVAAKGGRAGNLVLRRELGWDERRYEAAKEYAIAAGLLVRGQGRGGTLSTPGAGPAAVWASREPRSESRSASPPADHEPAWRFRPFRPGDRRRETTTDQHFQGNEPADFVERLVREAIQNSLDAASERDGSLETVRIRIALIQRVELSDAWYAGMHEHWRAISREPIPESSSWLVIEDFGTHGLYGEWNPTRAAASGSVENPYQGFFFSEGVSGKSASKLGRFGLGKHVFLMASRLRAFWAFSIPIETELPFVMGVAVWTNHRVHGREYQPDGYFALREIIVSNQDRYDVDRPLEDSVMIEQIRQAFGLRATGEPGTSIIVPAITDSVASGLGEMLAAVLRHFLPTILAGRLEVTFEEEGDIHWDQAAMQSGSAFEYVSPDVRRRLNVDISKVLASRVLDGDSPDWIITIERLRDAASWETIIRDNPAPPAAITLFEARQPLKVRVMCDITSPNRASAPIDYAEFDVVLLKSESADQPLRPTFVRQFLVVPDAVTSTIRGVATMVWLTGGAAAEILGNAENPSHERWTEAELRRRMQSVPKDWINLLKLVKSAPQALADAVQQRPSRGMTSLWDTVLPVQRINTLTMSASRSTESRDRHVQGASAGSGPDSSNALNEVLYTPQPQAAPPEVEPNVNPGGLAEPIPVHPRNVDIGVKGRAVRIKAGPCQLGSRLRVTFRLLDFDDQPGYVQSDFDLADDPGFSVEVEGGVIVERRQNRLVVMLEESVCEVTVTGFEVHRDLSVDARVTSPDESTT